MDRPIAEGDIAPGRVGTSKCKRGIAIVTMIGDLSGRSKESRETRRLAILYRRQIRQFGRCRCPGPHKVSHYRLPSCPSV